jgi:hypothetical protein
MHPDTSHQHLPPMCPAEVTEHECQDDKNDPERFDRQEVSLNLIPEITLIEGDALQTAILGIHFLLAAEYPVKDTQTGT